MSHEKSQGGWHRMMSISTTPTGASSCIFEVIQCLRLYNQRNSDSCCFIDSLNSSSGTGWSSGNKRRDIDTYETRCVREKITCVLVLVYLIFLGLTGDCVDCRILIVDNGRYQHTLMRSCDAVAGSFLPTDKENAILVHSGQLPK